MDKVSSSDPPVQIQIKNAEKSFISDGGQIEVLKNINLTVYKGQFCCLVGPSGCGKTTLLHILAGLTKPTSGVVELFHYDQNKPLNSMVFQEQSIFPWMTVFSNVEFGLKMRGVPKPERIDVVDHYIEKVGLTAFANAYPHQLSGGMKQRVSIARAFANDPEILLMDEPFAALDEQNKVLLQEELLRIWEESKKTVVFITHSIDEAIVLSDRALMMTSRPGTIKADVSIHIPRPRSVYQLKSSAEYGQLYSQIWEQLRDEVLKAKQSIEDNER